MRQIGATILKQKDITAARRLFLFSEMEEAVLKGYLERCRVLCFEAGQVIHSANNPLCGIGLILSGRAKILSGGGALLRLIRDGDSFGAASAFDSAGHSPTEVISSTRVRLLVADRSVICSVIENDPSAAVRYITFLSERIGFLNGKIGALSAGDTSTKAAGYLLSLDVDSEGTATLSLPLSSIASALNMGRASLYRTLDKFTEDGLISRSDDRVSILDRDALEMIAYKNRPK